MRYILPILLLLVFATGCSSNEGDAAINQGRKYFQEGAYAKAEKELVKALDKELVEYSKKELFTILGNTYNELELYDRSIEYHKKALAIDPNYVEALVNIGIVYRLISEFDLAEESYLKAQEIDPNDPELYASLGALYVYKGEVQLALKSFERSIKLDPQLAIAHSNYSLALAMNGEFDKADIELNKAVSMGYKNGDIIKERIENLKSIE